MIKKFLKKISLRQLIIFIAAIGIPSFFVFVFAKTSLYKNARKFAEIYTETSPYDKPVGGGGCFLKGTLISLADGVQKPIEKISDKDIVLSIAPDAKKYQQKVERVFSFKQNHYNLLVFDNNSQIKVTDEHPFLINLTSQYQEKDWKFFFKAAKELKEGNNVYSLENNFVTPKKIVKIQRIEKTVNVYNLEIANSHTFLANNIIVHNKMPFPDEPAPPAPKPPPPVKKPTVQPPEAPAPAASTIATSPTVQLPAAGGLDPQAACGHLPASQQNDCQTAVKQANGSGNYSSLAIQNDKVVNIDWNINYQSWLNNPYVDQNEWQKSRGDLYAEMARNLNYDPCEGVGGSVLEDCKSIALEAYTNKVGGLDIGRATYALKNNQWQELAKLEQEFSQLYGGRINFGQAKETYYSSNLREAADQLASTIGGVDGATLAFALENPELGLISQQDFKDLSEGCRSSADLLACYQEKSQKILTDKGIFSVAPPAQTPPLPETGKAPTKPVVVAKTEKQNWLVAKLQDADKTLSGLGELEVKPVTSTRLASTGFTPTGYGGIVTSEMFARRNLDANSASYSQTSGLSPMNEEALIAIAKEKTKKGGLFGWGGGPINDEEETIQLYIPTLRSDTILTNMDGNHLVKANVNNNTYLINTSGKGSVTFVGPKKREEVSSSLSPSDLGTKKESDLIYYAQRVSYSSSLPILGGILSGPLSKTGASKEFKDLSISKEPFELTNLGEGNFEAKIEGKTYKLNTIGENNVFLVTTPVKKTSPMAETAATEPAEEEIVTFPKTSSKMTAVELTTAITAEQLAPSGLSNDNVLIDLARRETKAGWGIGPLRIVNPDLKLTRFNIGAGHIYKEGQSYTCDRDDFADLLKNHNIDDPGYDSVELTKKDDNHVIAKINDDTYLIDTKVGSVSKVIPSTSPATPAQKETFKVTELEPEITTPEKAAEKKSLFSQFFDVASDIGKDLLAGVVSGGRKTTIPETDSGKTADNLLDPQRVEFYTTLPDDQTVVVSGWSFEGKKIKSTVATADSGKVIAALPPGNYTAFTQDPKDLNGEYKITIPVPNLSKGESLKPQVFWQPPSRVKIQTSYLNEDGTTTSLPDGQVVKVIGSPTNTDRKEVEETCIVKQGECVLDLPAGNYSLFGDFTIVHQSSLLTNQSYNGKIPFAVPDSGGTESYKAVFYPYVREKENVNTIAGAIDFPGQTSRGTEAPILKVYAESDSGKTYPASSLAQSTGQYEITDLPDGSYTINLQLLNSENPSKIQSETKKAFTIEKGIIRDESGQIPRDTSEIFDFPVGQMIAEPQVENEGNKYIFTTNSYGQASWSLAKAEYQVLVEPTGEIKVSAPDKIALAGQTDSVTLNIAVVKKKQFWLIRLFNKLKEIFKTKKARAAAGFGTLIQESSAVQIPQQQLVLPSDKVFLTINLYDDKDKNSQYDPGEEQVGLAGVKIVLEKTSIEEKYDLLAGWNLISLPILPTAVKTASDLLNDVNKNGADATTLAYYDNGSWHEFIRRDNGEQFGKNFRLKPNTAYFLRNHQETEWQVVGKPLEKPIWKLKKGWNAIGINNSQLKAEEVIRKINELKCRSEKCALEPKYENADALARWRSGYWDVFMQKITQETKLENYGNNFEINPAQGYFLRLKSPINYSF